MRHPQIVADDSLAKLNRVVEAGAMCRDDAYLLAHKLLALGKKLEIVKIGDTPGHCYGAAMVFDLIMQGAEMRRVIDGRACPVQSPILADDWVKAAREVCSPERIAS